MKKLILGVFAASALSGCYVIEEREFHPGVRSMSQGEVISMTDGGATDDQILDRISNRGIQRRPSADDLVRLKEAGVSSRVMAGMIEAPVRRTTRGFETKTYYYYRDPIVDDAIFTGAALLTGYLIWRHWR